MHPMNQARHIIRKSAIVQVSPEDLKTMKSVMKVVGVSAMCQDGITNAGGLQKLLSDGTFRISESSRVVNKSGHYGGGFGAIEVRSELAKHLLKMHVDGPGEPPWYSLARAMMRKGYKADQVQRMLKKTEEEMDQFLVPGGV